MPRHAGESKGPVTLATQLRLIKPCWVNLAINGRSRSTEREGNMVMIAFGVQSTLVGQGTLSIERTPISPTSFPTIPDVSTQT